MTDTLSTGHATEHSYRPALQELVETFGRKGTKAINEPTHVECGAPDFIVERQGIPIGHIECKDVGADLDRAENSEQLKRYRDALPNLILTDYVEFRWYYSGSDAPRIAKLGRLNRKGEFTFDRDGARWVADLLRAFFDVDTPTINNPRELAERMAAKAKLLRSGIDSVLDQEGESEQLGGLLDAYREVLIGDLTPADFADMQAQTAVYGLFAARCRHRRESGPFTRETAVFAETTPFLQDVFGRIAGPNIEPRIAWIVDDLALLLDKADMGAVLADFGSRRAVEDPVVHFYEDFLAAYDPELREMRGVYYTPEPVVSYIVRSIDHLLRDRFGLVGGLANTDKVAVNTSDGQGEESPRVLILDPAAGTGTFLREVIASIRSTIEGKGLAGAWPFYVRDHLLPRLFGFELLMAPYAMCHLKLALEIAGPEAGFTMPDGERLNVFLTNTLEEAHASVTGPLFAHEIAREATEADAVKRDKPVMVVLGNPPYSGHSANKGKWIRGLIESYKAGFPELKKPAQAKWLSDDYVKFIRFAQWRIERTGEGVLGFVTNHSYLDNPTFRGMRKSLMDTFDEIYLLDLHGNSKKKEQPPDGGRDENVFDIQQGVAIGLFVKQSDGNNGTARVFHADLWGERETGQNDGKYGWLAANQISTTAWKELSPRQPQFLFIPRDEALADEYEVAWSVPDIFSPNGDPAPGIVTTHDQFAISWNSEEAALKVERLLATASEEEAREIWRLCSQDQWQYDRAKRELADDSWRQRIEPILYRPFDNRATVFDRNVAVHRRERVMRHMLEETNLGLCIGRAGQVIGSEVWDVCYLSKWPSDFNLFRRGGNCLFPLYTHPKEEESGQERAPNLGDEFLEAVGSAIGLEFTPEGSGDLERFFGPEDVFHYIYAVLHSPEYRRRYADFLKSDFPRVPITGKRSLFAALVKQGSRLTSLHLMESEGDDLPSYPRSGSDRVDGVRYTPPKGDVLGRVFINAAQYFEGVAPETWEFTIGGYRPAEKWLKDRKNRELSYDDIVHYRRICGALAETPPIMACIDDAIESHGRWPLS